MSEPPRISTRDQAVAAAEKFADRLREHAADRDLAGAFPREEIHEFGQTGLLAVSAGMAMMDPEDIKLVSESKNGRFA